MNGLGYHLGGGALAAAAIRMVSLAGRQLFLFRRIVKNRNFSQIERALAGIRTENLQHLSELGHPALAVIHYFAVVLCLITEPSENVREKGG